MPVWKDFLTDEISDWLLEEENPAVRAAALTGLFDACEDEAGVKIARAKELLNGHSGKILADMEPGGFWGRPQDFYMRSKYHGTVWSFLLLAEMGSASEDERFQQAADFLLNTSQRADSGGFTYAPSTPSSGPRPAPFPCLTGNLVWGSIQAGFSSDTRVLRAVEWLAKNQHLCDGRDDMNAARMMSGMDKRIFESCWGRHTCMMGVVKALKGLISWPVDKRTAIMEKAVDAGVDFILRHRLIFRSHSPDLIANPNYLRFGFPLFWRTDALEILEILLKNGVRDEGLLPALQLVISKRTPDGRWLMEQSFNGRMKVRVEKEGKPGKWVTLRALKVVRLAFEAGLIG